MQVCRIIIIQKSGATKDRHIKLTVFNKNDLNISFFWHQSRLRAPALRYGCTSWLLRGRCSLIPTAASRPSVLPFGQPFASLCLAFVGEGRRGVF
jgi:hypothetical protein